MVQGNFIHGDYFVDCPVSLSTGRAVFGALLHIFITITAISFRSIYLSKLNRRLVPNDLHKRVTNLWTITPATSISEVFALRKVLFQDYAKRKLPFIFTSLICILALVFSSASTAIANASVVSNTVVRQRTVQGRLSYTVWIDLIPDSIVNSTSRVNSLEKANAPLLELFDFIPDDQSGWVYVADEWNNSWHGQCTYNSFPATDLIILPSNLSDYGDLYFQILVPSLGPLLPQWASANETGQGASFIANNNVNPQLFDDFLLLYFFANPADSPVVGIANWSSVNISLVNLLVHNIPLNSSGYIIQSSSQADIQIAECTFNNSDPNLVNVDKSRGNGLATDVSDSIISVSICHSSH